MFFGYELNKIKDTEFKHLPKIPLEFKNAKNKAHLTHPQIHMAKGRGRDHKKQRVSARRQKKRRKTALEGISKGSIRRLARRGGVKRISSGVYADSRLFIHQFMTRVLRDALTYTNFAQRKTVTASDVVYALKR